jgi:hypothetical protein
MQRKIEMRDERYDDARAAKYLGGEEWTESRVHDVESIDARPFLGSGPTLFAAMRITRLKQMWEWQVIDRKNRQEDPVLTPD